MKMIKKIVLVLLLVVIVAVIWIVCIVSRVSMENAKKRNLESIARDIAEEEIPKYYPDENPPYYYFETVTYPESTKLTDWVYGMTYEDDNDLILVNTVTKEIYAAYENDLIKSYAKELVTDLYHIDEADVDVDLSYSITLPYYSEDPDSLCGSFNDVLPLGAVVDEEFFRSILNEEDYELLYLVAVDENVSMDLIRKTDTGVFGHKGHLSIWQFSNEDLKEFGVEAIYLCESIDVYGVDLE